MALAMRGWRDGVNAAMQAPGLHGNSMMRGSRMQSPALTATDSQETMMTTTMNWRAIGWSGAAALLALPAVAMLFTREVNWTASDFLVFGAMLLAAGGGIELATRARLGTTGRLVAVAAVVTGFLLVWVELAVGIFD